MRKCAARAASSSCAAAAAGSPNARANALDEMVAVRAVRRQDRDVRERDRHVAGFDRRRRVDRDRQHRRRRAGDVAVENRPRPAVYVVGRLRGDPLVAANVPDGERELGPVLLVIAERHLRARAVPAAAGLRVDTTAGRRGRAAAAQRARGTAHHEPGDRDHERQREDQDEPFHDDLFACRCGGGVTLYRHRRKRRSQALSLAAVFAVFAIFVVDLVVTSGTRAATMSGRDDARVRTRRDGGDA